MLDWTRKGEGPEVVLVHGFLGSGKTFAPLTEHLIQKFTVTTLDLPGFGGSYDVAVPPSVEELARMVADTIQSIGITQCAILGHSLGAMISLELSLQRPELLEKMVIYGGCPDGSLPSRFESFESSINHIRAEGLELAAAVIVANWFQRGSDDPMFAKALAAGMQTDEVRAIAHVKTWDRWKARDRLGDIATPALILCGDSDRATHPDLSIEMWNKIPRSELAIIANAGHAAHLESPQVFNAIVERFLLQD
jgi:2-hydroxy-6-oxonona-2,4-dienedioate hydrolase